MCELYRSDTNSLTLMLNYFTNYYKYLTGDYPKCFMDVFGSSKKCLA